MSRPRARWISIADTPARYSHERVEHDGVEVLCVRLAGHADNNPDGVARVKDALDAFGATVDVEVSTLDVTEFANASDDACQILTHVFIGLPCCWITHDWDRQHDGQRWDLPASEHMAPTRAEALARVAGWRRAGGFSITSGTWRRDTRWTERGLVARLSDGDDLDHQDLRHRNRLVERVLGGTPPVRVLWPHPDRTGVVHEAERRRARLVFTDDRVTEVDFSRWQTGALLPPDWVEAIADLGALATLELRATGAREADILRAVAAHSGLTELAVEADALSPATRERLRVERPGLVLR